MTQIPVPSGLAEKVAAFLGASKTGQIIMNVNRGRIESYELKEHVRVTHEDNVAQRQGNSL